MPPVLVGAIGLVVRYAGCMPLVAIVGDQRLEAPSLDDAAWEELRGSYKATRLELVCGQPGYPRTSKLGVRHFVHKPGTECVLHAASGPESQEHLASKAALAAAARRAGWNVTIEYVGPDRDWIADVLIERSGIRIALEAQWSAQAADEFVRRTERYAGAGLRTIWFAGPKNRGQVAGEDLYGIGGTADALTITLPGRVFEQEVNWSLEEGAHAVFTGRFRKWVEVRPVGTLVLAKMARCYACQKWLTHWWMHGVVLNTRCGPQGQVALFMNPLPFRKSAIEPAVNAALLRELAAKFAAPVTHKKLKTPEGGEYIGQTCPNCGRVQGDFHLNNVRRTAEVYYLPVGAGVQVDRPITAVLHLCDDIGRGRCTPTPAAGTTFPVPGERGLVTFDAFGAEWYEPLPERRRR